MNNNEVLINEFMAEYKALAQKYALASRGVGMKRCCKDWSSFQITDTLTLMFPDDTKAHVPEERECECETCDCEHKTGKVGSL